MGQVLTPELMPDAVIATLANLNKGKWIGEMTDLQEHALFSGLAKDRKQQMSSGRGITVRYVMDHNHSAEHVGLFNKMNFTRDDAMVEGTAPWRYTDGRMVFDEREPDMNNGEEAIVDLVKTERSRSLAALVELGEETLAGAPADSNDNKTPYGLEYWVTKSATVGFNGGNHSSFSAGRLGISSSTYARHKNFTGQYTTVSDTEDTGLVWMMEKAADQCRWIAPSPEPGMGPAGFSRAIYCSWTTKNALKQVTKDGNDSLGFDLSTQEPVFRGAGIKYTPYYDAATDYPLYMLDLNHIYVKVLKDWFMKEIKLMRSISDMPHCFAVIYSLVWNVVCDDLRRQAVFYK